MYKVILKTAAELLKLKGRRKNQNAGKTISNYCR